MLFGLVLKLCFINGECHETVPETYNTLTECHIEALHQHAQGIPKENVYCKAFEDTPIN